MIESVNDRWAKISVLNNLKFEFLHLGRDKDIPVLSTQDYFKYPDLVRKFFDEGQWWSAGCNNMNEIIRPGTSLFIHPEICEFFTLPLVRPIASLLGVNRMGIISTNGNCFQSDMALKTIDSAFPHTDTMSKEFDQTAMIAYNINITKGEHIKTGFWSMNNKKSRLDFSWNDESDEQYFKNDMHRSFKNNSKWFQIDDYGPYKLETIHKMCYNSFTAYPTHFFHNPYIQPEWFKDDQRVTIAGFLDLSEKDLDFEDQHLDSVSYAWEFLHLNKVLNFHPENTKTI